LEDEAFFRFKGEFVFSTDLENFPNHRNMVFLGGTLTGWIFACSDAYVVYEATGISSSDLGNEDGIHHGLESSGGVALSKGHD
jgi:hypothetical protein